MTIWAAVIAAPTVWAQNAQPSDLRRRGFEPVDQRIEDIDPLHVSYRQVEQGLHLNRGQESLVYRRTEADGRQKFYFMRDGIVAEYDRSDYVRVENKRAKRVEVLTLVPPNTKFHIGLPAQAPVIQDDRPDPRIGAPLTGVAPTTGSLIQPADDARPLAELRQAQTQKVVQAIDRLLDPPNGR